VPVTSMRHSKKRGVGGNGNRNRLYPEMVSCRSLSEPIQKSRVYQRCASVLVLPLR
jgi:hypothetical protein